MATPFFDLPRQFTTASVILPLIDETTSLRRTVEILEQECGAWIGEYIIVTCGMTSSGSMATARALAGEHGAKVVLVQQKLPFLGGAIRDAFEVARSGHVVMMASDLETDPHTVKDFIEKASAFPDAIITATRWKRGASFVGYNPLKLVANFVFQRLLGILYWSALSDMTYGFRIFPTKLVQRIKWEETRHPFLLETLVKPLRLGIRIIEVPSSWRSRSEGKSNNSFLRNFAYFKTGFRARFAARERLLMASPQQTG